MKRLLSLSSGAVVVVAGVSLLSLPVPAFSQVASALLREADVLDGSDGQVISALSNTAVNHADGFAVTVNAEGGGNTTSYVWGAADDSPGAILFSEGQYGDYLQTSFESFFGLSNAAEVAYSPSCTDTVSGTSGLDGVWLDEMPIAVEEQVYPNDTNRFWSFGSRPGVTADGVPYWVGGVTDTQGGSTVDRGLFYGPSGTPLLFSGDILTGLPVPITNVSFDYRFSPFGTHHIAEVTLDAASSVDGAIEIDGAVALSGGEIVREGTVVPVESGGNGTEAWAAFDFLGIRENGDWMMTGDTDGSSISDEFIAINGQIVIREGDVLDGEALTGSIEGAYLNEDGDYAFIWDIIGVDGSLEALYLNDRLLLVENGEVDWDGDGAADAGTRLDNFTGISSLTLGDRNGEEVDLYFTADVEIPVALAGTDAVVRDLAGERGDEFGLSAIDSDELALDSTGGDPSAGTVILEGCFRMRVSLDTSGVDESVAGFGGISIRSEPSVLTSGSHASLHYELNEAGLVEVDLFSADGRQVRSLVRAQLQAGSHVFEWDGRDQRGRDLPAGLYFVRATSDGGSASSRVVIAR